MKNLYFILLLFLIFSCGDKSTIEKNNNMLNILKNTNPNSVAIRKHSKYEFDVIYQDRTERYFMYGGKLPQLKKIIYNE